MTSRNKTSLLEVLAFIALSSALGINSAHSQILSSKGKIQEEGVFAEDAYGASLAQEDNTLFVGQAAYTDPNLQGSVYCYTRIDDDWIFQQQLFPDVRVDGDGFGQSISFENGILAVGSPNFHNDPVGYVYLFKLENGIWTQFDKLESDDGGDDLAFGKTVIFNEGQLFVGMEGHDSNQGTIYVYEEINNDWVEVQELRSSLTANNFYFGRSFDVDGDLLASGITNYNNAKGIVSVYENQNGTWVETTSLEADDAEDFDRLGGVIDIFEGQVAVTAYNGDSEEQNNIGAVYIFEYDDTDWSQIAKIVSGSENSFNRFGFHIELGDELLLASHGNTYVEAFAYPAGKWVSADDVTPRESYFINDIFFGSDQLIYVGGQGAESEEDEAYVEHYSFDHAEATLRELKAALFADAAAESDIWEEDEAAFRYLDFIYEEIEGETEADYENLDEHYGESEEQRANYARGNFDRFIDQAAISDEYSNLLLDTYYYRTQAEAIRATNFIFSANQKRLGPPFSAPSGPEWVIDFEIADYQLGLEKLKLALEKFFELFAVNESYPEAAAKRKQIFIEHSPNRSYRLPQIIIDSQSSEDSELAFEGYKDLVLLFQILQKYGETAHKLATLQIANGQTEVAKETAAGAQRTIFFHGNMVLEMFPELDPDSAENSGLTQAITAWQTSIGNLDNALVLSKGDENILGFSNDFLMLTQRATLQQTQDFIYDSYDIYNQFLDTDDSESPLRTALESQADAVVAYETLRNNQDDLAEQYTESTISYEARLIEIVGAVPGEPGYDEPGTIEGSDLWQQIQSIEAARLRIQKNSVEMSNLRQEVQIEIERAGAVQTAVIKYGNKQAKLTRDIGHVEAAQAGVDSLLSPTALSKGGFALGLANGIAQAVGEEVKAKFEADKEKLAAAETAEIEGINSAAYVKTLWLQMNVLLVESQEAYIVYRQELGRAKALMREKAFIEGRISEREDSLAKRYYADPIHRLISNNAVVIANNDFNEAQRWLFFTLRALEYKWNKTFSYDDGLKTWDLAALFRSRNATELQSLYNAMSVYNELFESTTIEDDRYDWFSVKEDFMGLREIDTDGQAASYENPDTGEFESATEAFQRRLNELTDENGRIRIRFSTVRQIPGGTFFLGPRFNNDGSLADSGLYLDKIRWMKVRIPGNHTTNRNTVSGTLRYGGTSFVRRQEVGSIDPNRPDAMEDEMTGYSTRYQFFTGNGYRFQEALQVTISMFKADTNDERPEGLPDLIDILPSVQQIDSFRERSVAATDWELVINAEDLGTSVLDANEVEDIEIYFYHWTAERPD
ncbi:FG-GAP repeat protein [Puniceicoccaceae bacterium K14]|nr:FG-GAP repeat protein [Puniceicoccaceae bacterium K14]